MVVVFNCGFVLRIIAHLLRRMPCLLGFCASARLKISTQQDTDLPEPTGPRMPRKNVSSFINALTTSPSGLYLKSITYLISYYLCQL